MLCHTMTYNATPYKLCNAIRCHTIQHHDHDMGAQLGVQHGHMGCRQFGVQFGYLDVYDLPFCVPYDVVLLLDVPVVLFCVPYDVVLLLDVPMDLCTQLYSLAFVLSMSTMYSTWLSMYLKYQT